MFLYSVTIFLGSFLLFQIEPVIGRYILPWFGGSPAVWTTCMLFFQVMLLAGYSYAHLLTALDRRKQGYLHLCLLGAALLFLPIAPSPELWKPNPEDDPIWKILLLLVANIGVPFLILSATAPLVQHWFVRSHPGRSPYRFYALSNAASLLALLSYPFLVEPKLALIRQVSIWSWGFAIFVLCCGWCALDHRRFSASDDPCLAVDSTPDGDRDSILSAGSIFLWLSLSACGSAALLATTTQLCQEVAVIPFLWVAPLAIYLATFMVCFNSDKAYHRVLWGSLFAACLVFACRLLHLGVHATLPTQVVVYLATLVTCCMACHGELARSRPPSRHLTAYYLVMATGGALGGIFVALVAPVAFSGFWEYPIAMVLSAVAVVLAFHHDGSLRRAPRWLKTGMAVGILGLAGFTVIYVHDIDGRTVASSRNFYGVLRVVRSIDRLGPMVFLRNGRVMHGSQYLQPTRQSLPTTYYGPESGAGIALMHHPRRVAATASGRAIRVGVIGLGTGTLAAYGHGGDTFRFYEINNDVIAFADRYFTFRRDSGARIETVSGDARIVLESELKRHQRQLFDVLIVDAFSSDSIPVHLLTRECFAIYRYHLKRDGLLAVHVTNRFLNLVPIVNAQAEQLGLKAVLIKSPKDAEKGVAAAQWMILTSNSQFLKTLEFQPNTITSGGNDPASKYLWTDDFVSLWQILKW